MPEQKSQITEATEGPIREAAARRLSERFGFPVRLEWRETIAASPHVMRCNVIAEGDGRPATVIVKTPQRAERKARLLNDAASLDFLNRLPDPPMHRWPRFYGADMDAGILVEEDFGSETLKAALSETEAKMRAGWFVGQWAIALGELAVRTRGRAAEFEAVRAPYPPRERHMNFALAAHLTEGRDTLNDAFNRLNVSPAAGFDAEYAQIIATLAEPTPFDAFTVFDSHGENVLITDGRLRLIDFDWGKFRHALIDGMTPRMAQDYPDVYALPATNTLLAERPYRARLAPAFPAAQDDSAWDSAVAFGCAFWVAYYAVGYLPHVLEHGFAPGQEWLVRQLLKASEEFVSVADERRRYPALAQTVENLAGAMRQKWRERNGEIAPLLPYPAFRAQ